MESKGLDIPNRRAAISRRASLLTLGMAGWVAAFTHPLTAVGKKNSSRKKLKKAKKACRRDLATCNAEGGTCAAQVEECVTILTAACGDDSARLQLAGCCTLLDNCDATAFLTCALNVD